MRRVIDAFRASRANRPRQRGGIAVGRPVGPADLLGRPPVNLDTPELQRFLAGKRVLVTGAGGSIGSEICRQAMRFCPQRLLLVERAENSLFEIDRELRHSWVGADIRPLVGDVCDAGRVGQIFRAERPHVVFHCAAHKHVPMMEANAAEAVKNNVFGTKVVADAALSFGSAAFVLVSTDKAVNPTSVMGATKRFAELYVQSLNAEKPEARSQKPEAGEGEPFFRPSGSRLVGSGSSSTPGSTPFPSTRFLAVRFGNVLGSSGSVVPIFQKQIEAGGPVTVTHPEMMRYFMTVAEASQLVMQAGAIGRGGEIFVLDMGSPVRILDLACDLIERNGLRPNVDIEVRFCGIRPGEKLYEELAADGEQTAPTMHPKIRVWQLPPAQSREVAAGLERLAAATGGTNEQVTEALRRSVPEYRRPTEVESGPHERPAPALRLVAGGDGGADSAADPAADSLAA